MKLLRDQRCLHHPQREASARCPSCGHCFCRECATEHGGRILCASCLAREARGADAPKRSRRHPGRWLAGAAGLVAMWIVFYAAGRLLLAIPSEVHEGSVWAETPWWEEDKP